MPQPALLQPAVLLPAALAAAAIAAAFPAHSSRRLRTVAGPRTSGASQSGPRQRWSDGARLRLGRWGAAALAGLCLTVVVGGVPGLVLGAAAAAAGGRALARLEPAAARVRRERLAAELPAALDLLAACLAAGSPPPAALAAVASALDGPVADELAVVSTKLALGADPASVWAAVSTHPVLGPLGHAMVRAVESGAPVADGLVRIVEDQRRARRWDAEQKARSVGVRAAAPLALCFLPAFIVVGIVPTIASAFRQLIG